MARTRFPALKSRFVVVLWILAVHLSGSSAKGQTIASYTPTRVSAGDEVAVLGEGFGSRTSGHSIRYGRGSGAMGNVEIISWEATWGGNRARVRLPASIAAGTYWLALYEGWDQIARGPETLEVSAGAEPAAPPPVEIEEAPLGAVTRQETVRLPRAVPGQYDLTVTWSRLDVHDDSDPNGSGEWQIELLACVMREGTDDPSPSAAGCRTVSAVWPRGLVSGGGRVTMDVTDGRSYVVHPTITLSGIRSDRKVAIFTKVRDDDGLEADEWLQGHRIIFDPTAMPGRGSHEFRLDRSTLLYWSDNNMNTLEYGGTVVVMPRASGRRPGIPVSRP